MSSQNKAKTSDASSTSGRYREEIDGLRAIAVLAVIVNHLHEEWLPSGFLGVDVFFVISGYVITASIEGRADAPLAPFISAFYRRRIQRLTPALICCIAITSVFTCLFVNDPEISLITGATALVGVSNLYLLGESTNYFSADASYNTFLQTWSLGVEEQFYLCFPVLAWWLFQRQRKGGSSPALPVLATLSLISLLGFIYSSTNNPAIAYFLTPMRLWELLTGALIQQGFLRGLRLPAILPMVMLVASFWLNNDPPLESTLLVVVATAFLLPALKAPSAVKRVLMLPALRHLGRISYSLYLWHWSVICLARWTIGLDGWRLPLLLLLMIGSAEASYHWIENPLRKSGWSKDTSDTLLRAGGVTAVLGGLLVWLAQDDQARHLYTGQPTPSSIRNARTFQEIPSSAISRKNCNLSRSHPANDKSLADQFLRCVAIPANETAQTVFFAGDSHSSALMPLGADLLDEGFRINHMSMDSCPFPVTRYGHRNEACTNFQTLWQQWIFDQARPGDAVLISGYWLSHLGSGIDNRNELLGIDRQTIQDSDVKHRLFLEAINSFAKSANAKGIHVLLLGAGPRLIGRDRCLPEWFRPSSSLQTCERSLKRQVLNAQEMNAIFTKFLPPTITFINPIPSLCESGCTLSSIRYLLFDDDHLSAKAAKQLLTPVLSELRKAQS